MNEILLTALVTLVTGGGLGSLVTLRWSRMSAKNEAQKGMQDIYQELMDDLKRDRDFYKEQSEQLREQIATLNLKVEQLEREVRENRQSLKDLQPNLCGRSGCAQRIYMSIYKQRKVRKNGDNNTTASEDSTERPQR